MTKLDRRTITAAALTMVERTDLSDLTLSAVARELEVTQPALYYHLDSMDDILRWIGVEVRGRLQQVLTSAGIGRSKADAVRSVAAAWRQFSLEHPALYRSTQWHPVHGDAELEEAVGKVLTVLAGSLRSFDLTASERATAALALRSTLHGFASFELGAGNPSPVSSDDSFTQIVDLFLAGVEALSG